MFADIATGNTGTADVLFLIAVILAALAAVIDAIDHPTEKYSNPLLAAAVAAAAAGWLVL